MPPVASPRDHSRRHQPEGHRPARINPLRSHQTIPPPHGTPMTRSASDPRPYPQPIRPYSVQPIMPPPPPPTRIVAPPPHTFPPTPAVTTAQPLPQVPHARTTRAPLPRSPPPPDIAASGLAELADVAATRLREYTWIRIRPAQIPDIPGGLPQYPPQSQADSPLGSVPPAGLLPPVASLLKDPPPPLIPVTRVVHHWMDAQDPKFQLKPAVVPATPNLTLNNSTSHVRSSSADRSTNSSETTAVPTRDSQDPSPPLSTTSSGTRGRKRLFGELPEEGEESPGSGSGSFASLTLSGPSSPDRAKASREWHEASRRMLHNRSIWSPPTSATRLPKVDADEMMPNSGNQPVADHRADVRNECNLDGIPDSPVLLPQTPAVLADPKKGASQSQIARIRENNPLNYMLSEPMEVTDSQETAKSSEHLVTPSGSFVTTETEVRAEDPFPPLISPLSPDEPALRQDEGGVRVSFDHLTTPALPPLFTSLDQSLGKQSHENHGMRE